MSSPDSPLSIDVIDLPHQVPSSTSPVLPRRAVLLNNKSASYSSFSLSSRYPSFYPPPSLRMSSSSFPPPTPLSPTRLSSRYHADPEPLSLVLVQSQQQPDAHITQETPKEDTLSKPQSEEKRIHAILDDLQYVASSMLTRNTTYLLSGESNTGCDKWWSQFICGGHDECEPPVGSGHAMTLQTLQHIETSMQQVYSAMSKHDTTPSLSPLLTSECATTCDLLSQLIAKLHNHRDCYVEEFSWWKCCHTGQYGGSKLCEAVCVRLDVLVRSTLKAL